MTNRSDPNSFNKNPPWTREQIRAARTAPLVPLLEKRGLKFVETGGGNFLVTAYPGLIVKESYWRWPELLPTTVTSQKVPCSGRSEIPPQGEFTAGAW